MPTSAITFGIGNDCYAIAGDVVREVVAGVRPTRLPTAPAVLLGVFNLRGEVVPVFDIAGLLGLRRSDGGDTAIVVTLTAGPAGLLVDGLPKMETLSEPIARSQLRSTLGTFDVADGLAVLLDIEELIEAHAALAGHIAHDRVSPR